MCIKMGVDALSKSMILTLMKNTVQGMFNDIVKNKHIAVSFLPGSPDLLPPYPSAVAATC